MATHDAKPRVQFYEASLLRRPRLVERAHQIAEQLGARALRIAVSLADVLRRGRHVECGRIPLARLRKLAPAAGRLLDAAVQLFEELRVAHPATQIARVVDESLVSVKS